MNLQQLLREGDPLRAEPALAETDVLELRALVRSVRLQPDPAPTLPLRTWIVGGTFAAACLAAALVASWPSPAGRSATPVERVAGASVRTTELRQIYFSTRGGTRVIWVFNPDFERPR